MSESATLETNPRIDCEVRCPAEGVVEWTVEGFNFILCGHHSRRRYIEKGRNEVLAFWVATGEPFDEFALWEHTPEAEEESEEDEDTEEEEGDE